MDHRDEIVVDERPQADVGRFAESFEVFNKIINNLQRQYLTLEKQYAEQEQELAEINERLRQTIAGERAATGFLHSILASMTSGVIAVNQDGVISHFNPAAEKITGIKMPQALGKSYEKLFSSRMGKPSAIETVRTGRKFDAEDIIMTDAEGREIPISVSTALLRDIDGNRHGAVEIFFDLSKTKKLEVEVTRVKTLAALGEMAATVAHEVRNPLGGIGGFASLLRREVEGDEAKAKLVDRIIAGVNTLNMTVTALLDYTRREQLNLRTVPILDLIEDSVEYDRADHGESPIPIQIDIEVPDSTLRINCDPHLLRQVLLNLLRNSREAMPKGGLIAVRAFCEQSGNGSGLKNPLMIIEVEDTGEGIPAELHEKIFRPFFSTRRQGSGLGLASAWKTIQAHGGDIAVRSTVGKGTIFRITLPGNFQDSR